MVTSLHDRLIFAIESESPHQELTNIAKMLKAEGKNKEQICEIFEEFRVYLIDNGTQEQDDAVCDILDYVVGWGIGGLFEDV